MWDWTSMYWLWEATFPPTRLSSSLQSREAGWRATSIWMPRRQCTHPGSSPEKGGRGMLGIAGAGESILEKKQASEMGVLGKTFQHGRGIQKGQRLPKEWRGEQERSFRNFQSTSHWQFNVRMVSRAAKPHEATWLLGKLLPKLWSQTVKGRQTVVSWEVNVKHF